ncbi:MAG: hypothetical protein IJ861_10610 [Clostridia bacterium]|nr:hypothetical protein [Clostridia bacterium]
MGNIISFDENVFVDDDSLSLSNGLTDVLIDFLLLAGSELAESENQKMITVFLAEKQQTKIGIGNVGFDIITMPWQIHTFDTDKAFLLKTISYARTISLQQSTWKILKYKPNLEHLMYALDGFEKLINRMSISDVNENNIKEWINEAEKDDPIYCGFPKCSKHGIMLSMFGCKFCNDGL